MSTRTRLANKTIWALEDIIAACGEGRVAWRQAMQRAERSMDAVLMASLARLSDRLAVIERKARGARNGDYEE